MREVGRNGGGGVEYDQDVWYEILKQLVKMYFKIRLLGMRSSEGCLDLPVFHWVVRG